jgi:hypothetical protein
MSENNHVEEQISDSGHQSNGVTESNIDTNQNQVHIPKFAIIYV